MPANPKGVQPASTQPARPTFERLSFAHVRFAGIIIRRPAPANSEWPSQPTPAAKGFLIDTFL